MSAKPASANWRADTFTLTYRSRRLAGGAPASGAAPAPASAGPAGGAAARRSRVMSAVAWPSTQEPIAMIWPVSSARVMNWLGCIMPHCGCGQRISASKPASSPVSSATIGW